MPCRLQTDTDFPHSWRRQARRRDAGIVHPRCRDRLDAPGCATYRQACRGANSGDRQLPRRQTLSRAHILGSGERAGSDWAAQSSWSPGRRCRNRQETRRRDATVEHANEALGRERGNPDCGPSLATGISPPGAMRTVSSELLGSKKELAKMAAIPDKYLDLLAQKKAFANLATLMQDGSPQVTPVWFDYTGGAIRVNTAKGRQGAQLESGVAGGVG